MSKGMKLEGGNPNQASGSGSTSDCKCWYFEVDEDLDNNLQNVIVSFSDSLRKYKEIKNLQKW